MTFAELQEKHGADALEACRELLEEYRIQEFGEHPFRETILDAFAHGIIFARDRDAVASEPTNPEPEKSTEADYILRFPCRLDFRPPFPSYVVELPCGISFPVSGASDLPGYLDLEGEVDEAADGIQIVVPKQVLVHKQKFEAAMARFDYHREQAKKRQDAVIENVANDIAKSLFSGMPSGLHIVGVTSGPSDSEKAEAGSV